MRLCLKNHLVNNWSKYREMPWTTHKYPINRIFIANPFCTRLRDPWERGDKKTIGARPQKGPRQKSLLDVTGLLLLLQKMKTQEPDAGVKKNSQLRSQLTYLASIPEGKSLNSWQSRRKRPANLPNSPGERSQKLKAKDLKSQRDKRALLHAVLNTLQLKVPPIL